jgi:hypothetical protein
VRWFDGREGTREALLETKEELQAKIDKNLQRYKEAAAKDPSPKRQEALAGYQKFIRGVFSDRLRKFIQEKAEQRSWLARLDATPDLGKAVFTLVREAENEVRRSRGVPAVGESWVSETELLYSVHELLPDVEVVHHGQPKWLGRQHLDIWIPSKAVAIEYNGEQHFRAVGFFGGEDAFQKAQERDARKRDLCRKNKLHLIEIAYDQDLTDADLSALLMGSG